MESFRLTEITNESLNELGKRLAVAALQACPKEDGASALTGLIIATAYVAANVQLRSHMTMETFTALLARQLVETINELQDDDETMN